MPYCNVEWVDGIQLKEYARHVKHQHKEHMEYGDMNKGVVNPNGKDQ
jgi:hypothetical protein